MANPVKKLTNDERFKWGECSVCGAKHGEYCYPEIGLQLGTKVDGSRLQRGEGAHMKRLQDAPYAVELVPTRIREET